ncbi:MAG: acyltransferase [Bacteroidales bacterium]|nr:acyltransferase [Bacteroidales bacterium]
MKKIYFQSITKENTNFLKGLAIVLIVLHNYYKWINPITGQNEFDFSFDYIMRSYIFTMANPLELINVSFNFVGHYGVQVFIFISAYGLTKSFRSKKPSYGKFILHRFDKLYPSFVLAAMLFLIVRIIQEGSLLIDPDMLKNLGIQLSLLANFIPGKAIALNGPWWFYSMIFQFYFVFPFFMWLDKKTGNAGLLILAALSLLFSMLIFNRLEAVSLNSLQFFTGHLPEFCLGIFLAKRDKIKISYWLIFIAVLLFIGGNMNKWLWPFTYVSFTLLLLLCVQNILKIRNNTKLLRAIVFIGSISMYIFACHGFLRLNFIIIANRLDSPLAALFVGLLYFSFVTGVAWLMSETETSIRLWIRNGNGRKALTTSFFTIFLLIIGCFSILFIKNSIELIHDNQKQELLYSSVNQIKKQKQVSDFRYCDSLYYSEPISYFMSPVESYSPSIEISLDSISMKRLDIIQVEIMVFTPDSLASGHLVIELVDRSTNYRLLWNSLTFSSKSEEFELNKWFKFQYSYIIPSGYNRSNYLIKYYVWNKSQGSYFVDDPGIKLIGKQ